MLNEGKTIEQIATERGCTLDTVITHLIRCNEEELDIDMYQFVSKPEIAKIIIVAKMQTADSGLKVIFEALKEEVPYWKIKLALFLADE